MREGKKGRFRERWRINVRLNSEFEVNVEFWDGIRVEMEEKWWVRNRLGID